MQLKKTGGSKMGYVILVVAIVLFIDYILSKRKQVTNHNN